MKKYLKILIPILLCLAVFAYGVHWTFYDLQRIEGQDILREVTSPDGNNTLTVYLNNGGATTSYAVLCSVKDNPSGKERNIYWQYRCTDVTTEWIDDDTVRINNRELDVWKDSYDFRND